MGIFDFFKKKPEVEAKKIDLKDISEFVKMNKFENKEEEKNLQHLIKSKISDLLNNLNVNINALENLDLSTKKAEPRIKLIVKENLNYYINNIKRLIKELKEIKSTEFSEIIKEIDQKIMEFDNRSKLNYEKATILIGKELGEIKQSINNFLNETRVIISKNKPLIEKNKILESLSSGMNELNNHHKIKNDLDKVIKGNNEKIKRIQLEIDIKDNDIKELKDSDEYKKELKDIEAQEKEEKVLQEMIYDLKQLIDFKKLANVYHYDPKKMDIINQYKLSFKKSFEKDNGIEIIKLLNESNLTSSFISKKFTEIKESIKILNKNYRNLKFPVSNKIKDINENIKDSKLRIDDIYEENNKEQKRFEKLEENRRLTISDIRKELNKMNYDLLE
jgi:hypothetical protein